MNLREEAVEAMAVILHAPVPFDRLNDEDANIAFNVAEDMLDGLVAYLRAHADEWMNAAAQESILDAPSSRDDVGYLLAVLEREPDE